MKHCAAWLLFLAALALFAAQTMRAFGVVAFHADFFEKKGTVVVDAGHGGEDGGATGVHGELEKDINLAIALELQRLLEQHQFEVVMVRDWDTDLSDQNLPTVAQRKRSDLQRRLRLAEESGDCILLSIHQNFFTESQYSGAQVFYSANDPRGAALAEAIRASIVETLQPENTRQNKVGEGVYLLEQCQVPAVLVECGFLSNPEEAAALADPNYQKQMAQAIYNGLVRYLKETPANESLANG